MIRTCHSAGSVFSLLTAVVATQREVWGPLGLVGSQGLGWVKVRDSGFKFNVNG